MFAVKCTKVSKIIIVNNNSACNDAAHSMFCNKNVFCEVIINYSHQIHIVQLKVQYFPWKCSSVSLPDTPVNCQPPKPVFKNCKRVMFLVIFHLCKLILISISFSSISCTECDVFQRLCSLCKVLCTLAVELVMAVQYQARSFAVEKCGETQVCVVSSWANTGHLFTLDTSGRTAGGRRAKLASADGRANTRTPGRAARVLALPLPVGMRLLFVFTISIPPHPSSAQPHPSSLALMGLLAAHEAALGMKRAGPDPLVSPRRKGTDYMEN